MTYINHKDNLAYKNYGSEKDPPVDDSKDLPDYNSDVEGLPNYDDPSLNPGGDEYVEGDSLGEGEGPQGNYSLQDLRSYVADLKQTLNSTKDVKDRSAIKAEIKSIENHINRAGGMKGDKQQAEFAAIMADLANVQAKISGEPSADGIPGEENPSVDLKDLKKQLEKAIRDIDSRTNLTDDEKVELKAPLEKHLTEIKLAKDDPSKIDVDTINSDLQEAKTNTDEKDAYSPAQKGLSTTFDITPEELKLKAEAKGIDLDNISLPPSMELLNFLSDLSPEIKDAFKKVEDAINERAKFYESEHHAATANDQANMSSTTDTDALDLSHWQNLFNIKYHQDDKSKAVMDAMHDVVSALTPIFQALYPGQDVKAVETSGTTGWQKTDQEYKVADQISIGGTTIDLFNNTDGKLQASTTPDTEPHTGIPVIHYDGEGDGSWSPSTEGLQTYGGEGLGRANYDEDVDSGVFEIFTRDL